MALDLISDMLTRIRNASQVGQTMTKVPFSKTNMSILNILAAEEYIRGYSLDIFSLKKRCINIALKYNGLIFKQPAISTIARLSKPGKRMYSSYKNLDKIAEPLKSDKGIIILSTPLGVLSNKKALFFKQGGELFCYIN